MNEISRPTFDSALFGPNPARDARFTAVDQWLDCVNLPDGHPEKVVEFLHRQMNEELNSVENCARNLADFPDADWGLRMKIARQCADEARHVLMFRAMFEERGGRVGQYPVMNFQYRIITKVDTLIGRLAVQNRTFEAEGVDAVEPAIETARQDGDLALADLYDSQLADEIGHVRFANEYIAQAAARHPREVMHVGRALDYAMRAFLQVMGDAADNVRYGVNQQGRIEAGFQPAEVEFAAEDKAARKRSHAPR